MAKRGNPEDLAATVALLRAMRGWSKKQLAEASGVDRSQLSRYELSKEVPSDRTLQRLAAAVGLPWRLLEPTTAFIRRLREAMAGEDSSEIDSGDFTGLPPETKQALLEAIDRVAVQAHTELKLHAGRHSAKANGASH